MRTVLVLAAAFLLLPGCTPSYLAHHGTEEWQYKVSPEVMEAWRKHQSYYALIEIIDTYINPWCNPATKADVRKYLGPGDEGPHGYPGASVDCWVYTSSRKVPYGSYCLITFGKDGKVKDIEWASE